MIQLKGNDTYRGPIILSTAPLTQCAAVRTYRLFIKDPPQLRDEVPLSDKQIG